MFQFQILGAVENSAHDTVGKCDECRWPHFRLYHVRFADGTEKYLCAACVMKHADVPLTVLPDAARVDNRR